ncbi:MAG: PAS domain S-box protein [Candidatus Pacebacteria bacterium]|jgi:PAS domain S-box-containing protein|nr:PAS domain S-box protein [Candidatus Paceibacterota bacterium]
MPSGEKIVSLRRSERVLLVFILLSTAGLAVIYGKFDLQAKEILVGVAILLLMVFVRLYVQRKIDTLYSVALSQINYAHDDAFSALFERSPVAYLTINPEGVILESNAAAVRFLRAEVSKIKRTNFLSRVNAEEVDPIILQGKFRSGITIADLEVPLVTFTGEAIWVLLSIFSYRGGSQRMVALVDITEQKQIDSAKSEFVALATHQLRTPIAAIRWNVELLQKSLASAATESQTKYLGAVERNVLRMINLINDFLSVSKLEMGTYATSEEQIELSVFFSNVLEEFAGKIEEKQIVLTRTEKPSQVVIKTDMRLFQIIVSNLVSNAIKYLHPPGKLEISYQLEGNVLTIVVADNGIGIPAAELDKLFTKFYRASNAQSHQAEGTGLGLYIVKQSIELLGGQIGVDSKEGVGTRFTVVLPVRVVLAREIS